MYYSTASLVEVSGQLNIGGNLDMSNSYNATDNTLRLTSTGVAKVDGTFELYYHSTYGSCWLELDGGTLALAGDQSAMFAEGSGTLNSVKVRDDTSGEFQAVAVGSVETEYYNKLEVTYVSGAGEEFEGYTVVRSIPEPATLSFMVIFSGVALFIRKRSRR